jgi:hypothetical protein
MRNLTWYVGRSRAAGEAEQQIIHCDARLPCLQNMEITKLKLEKLLVS